MPLHKIKWNRKNQNPPEDITNHHGAPSVPPVHINPSNRTDEKNRQNSKTHQFGHLDGRTWGKSIDKGDQGHLVKSIPELRDNLTKPEKGKITVSQDISESRHKYME